MSDVWMIARRELGLQLRSKGFVIGLLCTMTLVAAMVAVPQLIDTDESYEVGLVGAQSQALSGPIEDLARQSGVEVRITEPDDEPAARASIENGDLDAAVIDARGLLGDGELDSELSGVLQGSHQTREFTRRLASSGLTETQLTSFLDVEPLPEVSVTEASAYDDAQQGLAFLIMLSLLFLFMTTTVGLAYGVVEEKGSRIVEILLVAVKPWQLLTGKLLAFGVVGAIQLLAFAAAGLGTAVATGVTEDLPPGMAGIVGATFVGYVLGYLCFGSMAAALGSLVSRQEETNGALTPMTLATVLTYLGAYIAYAQPGTVLSDVLTVLPPVSSIALPVQVATGTADVAQILVASVLLILLVVTTVAIGARIYEGSVLRTGPRVRLREAIRS